MRTIKKIQLKKFFIYLSKKRKFNCKIFTYETEYVKKAITFQILKFSVTLGISR